MYATEARMLAAKADRTTIILRRVLEILREEATLGNTDCTLPPKYSGLFLEKELANMGYEAYSTRDGMRVYWSIRD